MDRPSAVPVAFGIVAVWIATVFVVLAVGPRSGAESAPAHATDLATADAQDDADAAGRLFLDGTVGNDYASGLLEALHAASPGPWRATTVMRDGVAHVTLTDGDAGVGCVSWHVQRHDGRWYLDDVPPVRGSCAP